MTIVPLELLKIKDDIRDGYQIFCRVHIKNKEFRMLVDTGASMTIFDVKKLKDISNNNPKINDNNLISVGSNNVDSQIIMINELKIGDILLKDYEVLLIDLDSLNSGSKKNGNPLIHGILGGDILNNCNAIINYKNREMILT